MAIINKTNIGQVIQVARGNLEKRLQVKPLAKGELFIHIDDKYSVTSDVTIHDLVTDSDIKMLFKGDLFAGNNSSKEVYAIGSGGALKWGGILFADTTYETAVAKAKSFPNYIFLYNGTEALYPVNSDLDISIANRNSITSPADSSAEQYDKVDRSYEASSSEEYLDRINPGDMFFYSAALDQVVVMHLSRSTDALTKINVDALVSDSMYKLLAEEGPLDLDADQNYLTAPSTLKTFIDGPARHYQYLVEKEGWSKVTVETPCEIVRTEGAENIAAGIEITPGTITLPTDVYDGEIFYVPFSTSNSGKNTYKCEDSRILADYAEIAAGKIREGDLILAIPSSTVTTETGKKGVDFAIISLYGALLDKFYPTFNGRADTYATDIWESGIAGSYTGDVDYFVNNDSIQAFIDRLFTTKVDIDPITGKIISSQLPDYLLGAPKYMGHTDYNGWSTLDPTATALDFAKTLLTETSTDLENLDASEDDTGSSSENSNNVEDSASVNEKLKTGCYWIYTGEDANIKEFTSIFHLSENQRDDYTSETNAELATLKETLKTLQGEYDALKLQLDSTTDETAKATLEEEITAKEAELTSCAQQIATAEETAEANGEQLLCKGDWIIYNGELGLFEVIDNSSSFIGILVGGVKVASVAEFTAPKEAVSTAGAWDGNKFKNATSTETLEDLNITASNNTVKFENRNKVFAAENEDLLNSSYLPKVADKITPTDKNRTLVNSRFKFVSGGTDLGNEIGLKVHYGNTDIFSGDFVYISATLQWVEDWDSKKERAGFDTTNGYIFNPDKLTLNDYTIGSDIVDRTWDLWDSSNPSRYPGRSGLNFGWLSFMEDRPTSAEEERAIDRYSFGIGIDANPILSLPYYSGTLTTEEYVNTGFTVVKGIINDLYDKILEMTTKGHENWLQTIRLTDEIDPKTGENRKEIFDSQFKQIADTVYLKTELYFLSPDEVKSYDERTAVKAGTLSVYQDLSYNKEDTTGKRPLKVLQTYSTNYELGSAEDTGHQILNPSSWDVDDQPENILPNHSGVLLNNNSVIDCGEWY